MESYQGFRTVDFIGVDIPNWLEMNLKKIIVQRIRDGILNGLLPLHEGKLFPLDYGNFSILLYSSGIDYGDYALQIVDVGRNVNVTYLGFKAENDFLVQPVGGKTVGKVCKDLIGFPELGPVKDDCKVAVVHVVNAVLVGD